MTRIGSIEVRSFGDAVGAAPTAADRFRSDKWAIGTIAASPSDLLSVGRTLAVDWLPTPRRGTFLADPFPVDDDILLCEEFTHRSASARLVTVRRSGAGEIVSSPIALDAEHVSYPFVIAHADGTYVVPERSFDGGVHLYELIGERLQHVSCLVADRPVLDPTVFEHEGTWYLFASLGAAGSDELRIWWAPTLDGPWTLHPAAPITGRGLTLRPAGAIIRIGESLLRPSQDCRGGYGRGVILNAIDALSRTEYHERPTVELVAATGPFTDGLHTLNVWADRIVVDGKRRRLRPDGLVGRVRRRRRRASASRPPGTGTI